MLEHHHKQIAMAAGSALRNICHANRAYKKILDSKVLFECN